MQTIHHFFHQYDDSDSDYDHLTGIKGIWEERGATKTGGKSASIRVMRLLRVGVQTECDKWIQAAMTVQQIFKRILLPSSTLIVEASTFGKAQEKRVM